MTGFVVAAADVLESVEGGLESVLKTVYEIVVSTFCIELLKFPSEGRGPCFIHDKWEKRACVFMTPNTPLRVIMS